METRGQPESVVPPGGPAHQKEGGSKALEWEEALIKQWKEFTDEERKERMVDLARGLVLLDKGDELLRSAPQEERESEGFKKCILQQKVLWEWMFKVLSALGPGVTHAVYSVKNSSNASKQ